MDAQQNNDALSFAVSIDIHREAAGFVSARVYRLDGTLIVITPPCDSQDGAISIAHGMWLRCELCIPASFSVRGTA